MSVSELTEDLLYHRCDPESIPFDSTDEVSPLDRLIGQPRAVAALHFGIGIQKRGYNVFALGGQGMGKYSLIRNILDRHAESEPTPEDLCYVYNFKEQHKPRLLSMAAGKGLELVEGMKNLEYDIRHGLRTTFESEDYQNRLHSIEEELKEKQQEIFEALQRKAKEYNIAPLRTPAGLVFAPVKDGEVVPPDELKKYSKEERQELEEKAVDLRKEAQRLFKKMPQLQREIKEKQKEFNKEVIEYTISPLLQDLRGKFHNNDNVLEYLKAVEKDIIENVHLFLQDERQQAQQQAAMPADRKSGKSQALRRYKVNQIIDHNGSKGAPVVHEENPNYHNLFGRVEHMAQMGTLLTDFTMIRSGALHRANGGYLVLDALKVLMEPFAWESLKRILRSGKLKIESLGQRYSLISTVSLEPEPLPLKVKLVLTGSPMLYYLLKNHDPEFGELFKVAADFAYVIDRDSKSQEDYSRMIATTVKKEELLPFSRDAVARVIEHSSRLAGDSDKLSMHMEGLADLLREADFWASQNGNDNVERADVQKALDSWIYRSDRIRERMQEQITKDIVIIDTEGSQVGQINGLSVLQLGDFAFGRPSRITARIRLGKGDVVDIEREVAMGGPIHSKGVLILSGFLGSRYAIEHPLALSASLVFEQSYGGIEGDSASSAELYALLSSISGLPINQCFAVTGSVDQGGRVQAIGGVNEKIEGFFDICMARGLNGEQSVLIPKSNIKHLMLRQDVIDCVREGKFHIYPVETIDQGIELLTGLKAGEPDQSGKYPEDSVNGKVFAVLAEMADKRLKYIRSNSSAKED
ncbi:MAG: AAA family ATPase [Desulfovibrionaceae bacterium]|nr:AAA family ATPase [Desulfovibrionaceae bacterium]